MSEELRKEGEVNRTCARCGCKFHDETLTVEQVLSLLIDTSNTTRRRRWLIFLECKLKEYKAKADKWDQVYQDRCEGALIEVTLAKERGMK